MNKIQKHLQSEHDHLQCTGQNLVNNCCKLS